VGLSDKDILNIFNEDDERALEVLYVKYYRALNVFAMKYLNDLQVAEDIVQDIFIRFWENQKYQTIQGSLKNYLFIAVRNRSLNYLESFHHSKKKYLDDLDEVFSFEQFNDDELQEKKEKLHQEIEKLPQQMQVVLKMIVFEKKKYREVSEELDISLNTVKTHFSRSLKKLRGSIDILTLIFLT